MSKIKAICTSLGLLAASVVTAVAAQPEAAEPTEVIRPVNSSYMLEAGSSHLLDSYLSPLHYSGWGVAFTYERMQAMKFSPEHWRQQLVVGARIADATNSAGNASLSQGEVYASWGMLRRWLLPHNLQLAAGASAQANLGALYSARNSNNPVDADVDIDLNLTGYAAWTSRLWRLPIMLRWQSTLALTGIAFRQQYDELYYEIALGNRAGLIHGFYPGNLLRWNNLVTLDLDVSHTRLRVGFRSAVHTEKINNITVRSIGWSAVLGATGDWISLSGRSSSLPSPSTTRIIKAY